MFVWEPSHPTSWAQALGLVHVPLFGRADVPHLSGEHAVLLDGPSASFHVVSSSDPQAALADANLRWAWSSNLAHSVAIDSVRGLLFLRRWDDRDAIRKFALPPRPKGAADLLDIMRTSTPPKGADVVLHMLRAFRVLRNLTDTDDPLFALRLFNLSLVTAEAVEHSKIDSALLREPHDVSRIVAELRDGGVDEQLIRATGVDESAHFQIPPDVFDYFLSPEPQQQYVLAPSLLMRHASGQLYQEAHLTLEREYRQLLFPGFAPAPPEGVSARRDVRFTPATLARTLVEESLSAYLNGAPLPESLTFLDPACGSGVFLIEVVRELISREYRGAVRLHGFDVSPLSVAMARFCLAHAVREASNAGFSVTATVEQVDALTNDWGSPDIVLMNPPFVPWESMDAADQEHVKSVLGPLAHGRIDKAMAFVLRGLKSVQHGGTLASVLPAALLETASGEKWRSELAQLGELRFVGRFEGFGYFRASMVEPAMIVLKRTAAPPPATIRDILVLIARETAEDDALRALRLLRSGDSVASEEPNWDLFSAPATSFEPVSWLPHAHSEQQLLDVLWQRGCATVGDLFDIRQGARTGANDVFMLTRDELRLLPRAEQRFFRPAADNSTIRDGRLTDSEYVFYPYGEEGLLITTEDQLAERMPRYYKSKLKPRQPQLASRAKVPPSIWWKLTWEREWQHSETPKLVSTYFGDRGSFAYDSEGHFVVVQGHGWIPKRSVLKIFDPADPEAESTIDFHASPLPWAYLALLNSTLFERLLATVAPRVQGGQFNLSPRFVSRTFLPDLFDDAASPEVVSKLGHLGQKIHTGQKYQLSDLDEVAARAYGVPLSLLRDQPK